MIDCVNDYNGCIGGLLSVTFRFFEVLGVTPEYNYPTKNVYSGFCPSNIVSRFTIERFEIIKDNCLAINQNLKKRPLTVSIDASNMKQYRSGVFNDCSRTP